MPRKSHGWRICFGVILFGFVFLFFFWPQSLVFSLETGLVEATEAFFKESEVPGEVKQNFLARAKSEQDKQAEWVVEFGDEVFSLVAIDNTRVDRGQMQSAFSIAMVKVAAKKAINALFFLAVGETFSRRGYTNREAVVNALLNMENQVNVSGQLLPGLKTTEKNCGNYSMALARVQKNLIQVFRARLPDDSIFRPAYCAALYPFAQTFMASGKYEEALPTLKDVLQLRWANPDPYLDVAECFKKIGKIEDAKKMALEIHKGMLTLLTSAQAERLGDFLLEFGLDPAAKDAFDRSLQQFHREREK